MLPISETYLHSVCEIKTLESIPLGSGLLESVEEEAVQIVRSGGFLPTLTCNTLVNLHILHSSGENKTLIGKVYLSNPDLMRVVDVQNLSDYERRNFFRLKMSIHTQVYPILEENSKLGSIQPFPVKITDLSISGCFIQTKKKMELNHRFMLVFPLNGAKISFTCQVQRIDKPENKFNGYGCVFLNNTNRQNDLLCQYLFEQQRELIKRARSRTQLQNSGNSAED